MIDQFYRLILHSHQQKWAKAILNGGELLYPHQSDYFDPEVLKQVISGKITAGIMLLQPGSNLTKAGVIDLDCPRDAVNLEEGYQLALKLQKGAQSLGIKTYIEFSGNRGWHLWAFFLEPLPGNTAILLMQKIAKTAQFEAKEIFPCHSLKEGKCIKLPGSLHLKSGKKSGFVDAQVQWEDNYPLLPEQEALMADFVQNKPYLIAEVVLDSGDNGKLTNASVIKFDFEPNCINYLRKQGAYLDIDYNQVNLTLVRYALASNLTEAEAFNLASEVASNTSEAHPTSKSTVEAKLRNFKSAYTSAQRDPDKYIWSCAYVMSGKNFLSELDRTERGCIGSNCSKWGNDNKSNYSALRSENKANVENFLSYRSLWKAIESLSTSGRELRISTILPLLTLETQPQKVDPAISLQEAEILACCLQKPLLLTQALSLDLPAVGFSGGVAISDLKVYLEGLYQLSLPNEATFTAHLDSLRERGLRELVKQEARELIKKADLSEENIEKTLDHAIKSQNQLLRRTISELVPLSSCDGDLMADLFGTTVASIPTPSKHLNSLFNGGFAPGKLTVIAAPPGQGKTTFCAWCGDFAASQGIPVLVCSYEMSRYQLYQYTLSRKADIDSGYIERKAWLDPNHPDPESLLSRVVKAATDVHNEIAPYLTLWECGMEHTPARLKGAISQVRHNAKLSEEAPVLVIIDYLQLLNTGDDKLDTSAQETLRVSRIATMLKQLARDTGASLIAISDVTKDAYQRALKTGSLDLSALRDSFKIAHAADAIALLQTGTISTANGNHTTSKDQLELLAQKYPERERAIENLRQSVKKSPLDTFARLTILKNRGGGLGDPIFLYKKATHKFLPLNLELNQEDEYANEF